VFIVDDHPLFREGLVSVLSKSPVVQVCGQAGHADDAKKAILEEAPDLVLLEVALPDKDGIEFIKDLHYLQPQLMILVISMHDEVLYAERVLAAGARGYIMKQEGPEAILEGVQKVLGGGIHVSPRVAESILRSVSGGPASSPVSEISQLTRREFDVFRLIGQGKNCRDIARELSLSVKTVNTHRGHIKRKFCLETSAQLIRHAVRFTIE
jgi:DNA-binding NarL/FixJ family response regulator